MGYQLKESKSMFKTLLTTLSVIFCLSTPGFSQIGWGSNPPPHAWRDVDSMFLSAEVGDTARVKMFISRSGIFADTLCGGFTALTLACQNRQYASAAVLLRLYANPNRPNGRGEFPLQIAVVSADTALIALLLTYRADPNLTDDSGRTALHLAVSQKDLLAERAVCVRYLMEHGADPLRKDRAGQTPYELASANQLNDAAKLLIPK
jgi:hypothetical protein